MDYWKLLDIPPTTEKREIKRAYAKLLKVYHPEDDPKMFKQVQEAYEAALSYADSPYARYDYTQPDEMQAEEDWFEENWPEEARLEDEQLEDAPQKDDAPFVPFKWSRHDASSFDVTNNTIFADDQDLIDMNKPVAPQPLLINQGVKTIYKPPKQKSSLFFIAMLVLCVVVVIVAIGTDPTPENPIEADTAANVFAYSLGEDNTFEPVQPPVQTPAPQPLVIGQMYTYVSNFTVDMALYDAVFYEDFDLSGLLISRIVQEYYDTYGIKINTNSRLNFVYGNKQTIVFILFHHEENPDIIVPYFLHIFFGQRETLEWPRVVVPFQQRSFDIHFTIALSDLELAYAVNVRRINIGQTIYDQAAVFLKNKTGIAFDSRRYRVTWFDYENIYDQIIAHFFSDCESPRWAITTINMVQSY